MRLKVLTNLRTGSKAILTGGEAIVIEGLEKVAIEGVEKGGENLSSVVVKK